MSMSTKPPLARPHSANPYAQLAGATQELNARVGKRAEAIAAAEAAAEMEKQHRSGVTTRRGVFLTGGDRNFFEENGTVAPRNLRRSSLAPMMTALMASNTSVSKRRLSVLVAREESQWQSEEEAKATRAASAAAWDRFWKLPRHKQENVPLVGARLRNRANTNQTPSDMASMNQDQDASVGGVSSSRPASAALSRDFSTAFAKCDFLRQHPEERRAFSAEIDALLREEKGSLHRKRRARLKEVKEAEREMAESYLLSTSSVSPPAALSNSTGSPTRRSPVQRSPTKGGGSSAAGAFLGPSRTRDTRSPSLTSDMLSTSSQVELVRRDNEDYMREALKASQALRRRQRESDAKFRREGLQSWRTARAIDELQRPEFMRVRRLREAEIEVRENTWATLVVLASGLFELHDRFTAALMREQLPSDRIKRFTHSGVAMQAGAALRDIMRARRASATIWRFWKMLRHRVIRRKRCAAVLLVRRFLRDLGESIRIPLAIKKKLRYVKNVQQRYRQRAELRQARRALCVRQLRWLLNRDVHQDEHETAKLRSMVKQHERELALNKTLHRVAKQESMAKMVAMVDARLDFIRRRREACDQLTDAALWKHADEIMERRERQYGESLLKYGSILRVWHIRRAMKEDPPPPPPLRPMFRTLLTVDEAQVVILTCMEDLKRQIHDAAAAANRRRSSVLL